MEVAVPAGVRCFKCREAPGVMPSRDGAGKPYCALCAAEFVTKACGDALFRFCHIPSGKQFPMVVAVSGGPNSLALLYLLGDLAQRNVQRPVERARTYFTFKVLHLNEAELLSPQTEPARTSGSSGISSGASTVDTATHFDTLERLAVVQPLSWRLGNQSFFTADDCYVFRYSDFIPSEQLAILQDFLHRSPQSLSDRQEAYFLIRRRVLAAATRRLLRSLGTNMLEHVADQDDLSFTVHGMPVTVSDGGAGSRHCGTSERSWALLLLGDNAVQCTVSALHSVVTGRGSSTQLVHAAGFSGFMDSVISLRPLRLILPRELYFFGRTRGIASTYTPIIGTAVTQPSCRRVLEQFVVTLAKQFPSAVFNVLHTVGKLDGSDVLHEYLVTTAAPVEEHGARGKRSRGGEAGERMAEEKDEGTRNRASLGPRQGSIQHLSGQRVALGKTSQYNAAQMERVAPPTLLWRPRVHATAAGSPDPPPPLSNTALCLLCGTRALSAGSSGCDQVSVEAVPASHPSAAWTLCYGCRQYQRDLLVRSKRSTRAARLSPGHVHDDATAVATALATLSAEIEEHLLEGSRNTTGASNDALLREVREFILDGAEDMA